MVSPTLGVGGRTALGICRSACRGVSVAAAILLPVIGSDRSAALTAAVCVWGSGLTTRAWICKVCGVLGVTVPAAQTSVALLYVPWLGVADTKLSPAGSTSWTVTLVAGSGPLSVRVTVKVMVSPTLG